AADESTTRSDSVLLMMIGRNPVSWRFTALISVRAVVEYRNTVTGESNTFTGPDSQGSPKKLAIEYEMECVDCHNRPTHVFDLPERAMDKAMTGGDISVSLP